MYPTGEFAVLDITATPDHPAVVSWHETKSAAIEAAAALNERQNIYRAVESSRNGIWHSLTGESLYV